MQHLKTYLDSTYLKTAQDAGISDTENQKTVTNCIDEAIHENFKLVMIRPEFVSLAKKRINKAKSGVLVGTVIDFPLGTKSVSDKIAEALIAIKNGADELDFVCNYSEFIQGNTILIKNEIVQCCKVALENHKTAKIIIEVAALNATQIIKICSLIKNVVMANFKEECYQHVFVKSSTGFYNTPDNSPNGATFNSIIMMLENASPLQIKASGGISNQKIALQYIQLGVKRIGTSSAKALIANATSNTKTYY
ncbi:MAG: deoxyribose-phosphate aldolase [Flavobacterium sp.]|jgi:deoxyribose-phosphate aldolase